MTLDAHKRVRIIVPEVHDGLGGVHRIDETPSLPADIAALFVAKKMATLVDDTTSQADLRKQAAEDKTARERLAIKTKAELVMEAHDRMPAQIRKIAAEGKNLADISDEEFEKLTRPDEGGKS